MESVVKTFNLPMFLTFKKALKEQLLNSMKLRCSGMKGRSIGHQVQELIKKDTALAADEEIQGMGIDEQVRKVDDLAEAVRAFAEKTFTAWCSNVTKSGTFKNDVQAILGKEEALIESVEDLKHTVQVVKYVKFGLKKASAATSRRATYLKGKQLKQLMVTGLPEKIAKMFAQAAETAQHDPSISSSINWDQPFFCQENCENILVREFVKQLNSEATHNTVTREAQTLIPAMRNNVSVMKPIALEKCITELAEDSVKFSAPKNSPALRAWVIIGTTASCTYGFLRWPLPGAPCFVGAKDSGIVVCLVEVAKVLKLGLPTDQCEWTSDDESKSLKEEDISINVLKEGECMYVPAGFAILWAFLPRCDAGASDITHGKLIMQPLMFEEWTVAEEVAKSEVQHRIKKVFAGLGSKKPWSDMKADTETWMARLQVK